MVRKVNPTDASRMADIQIFGWRNAYRGIIDDKILFSKLDIEKKAKSFRASIEEGKELWYVYEEDDIIKGMMCFGNSRDEDRADSFELYCIYVDPLMLRQSIGKQMIEFFEAEAKAKGFNKVILWVLEKNQIGVNFYEKNGYRFEGKRQNIEQLNAVEIRYYKEIGN